MHLNCIRGLGSKEPEKTGGFWGHFEVRAHALEAGTFVVSGCAVSNEMDVATEFPYKDEMNLGYANGGSEVVAPHGIAMAGPIYGEALIYAEIVAWMIKATKAIIDPVGHYAPPSVVYATGDRDNTALNETAVR